MRSRPTKKRALIAVGVLIVAYGVMAVGYALGQHDQPKQTSANGAQSGSGGISVQGSLDISNIDVYQLWTGTNEQRANAGIAALSLNPKLNQSAKAKCDDMVAKNYWSHNDPSG